MVVFWLFLFCFTELNARIIVMILKINVTIIYFEKVYVSIVNIRELSVKNKTYEL